MTQAAETLPDVPNSAPKNIPIESIIDYRTKGLTTREIAELLGCSHSNIVQRLQGISNDIDTLSIFKQHKADIVTLLTKKQISAYFSLTDEEQKELIKRRGLVDYGIAYDKMRLELGESTQNVDVHADIQAMKALKQAQKHKIQDGYE